MYHVASAPPALAPQRMPASPRSTGCDGSPVPSRRRQHHYRHGPRP
jgi:hypothetical protein